MNKCALSAQLELPLFGRSSRLFANMEPNSKINRWVGFTAVLILSVLMLGIILISAGIFDPKPLGTRNQSIDLGLLSIPAGLEKTELIPAVPYHDTFSLRLTASLKEGEQDSGYGLIVGPEEDYFGVAVSPLGYLTLWHVTSGSVSADNDEQIIPWRTWPHVQQSTQVNEIWLDIKDRHLTRILVNREILWEGEIPIQAKAVSLWGVSFGEAAIVDFSKLDVYFP